MNAQKEVKKLTKNINNNETIANELYRIHCYCNTLAKLCRTGGSDNAIDPEHLEQIFKDIADVTDEGISALNNTSKNEI